MGDLWIFFCFQNWEEEEVMEEKMEEDKEGQTDDEEDNEDGRTESKANGAEDMDHENDSEEEWEETTNYMQIKKRTWKIYIYIYFHFIFMLFLILLSEQKYGFTKSHAKGSDAIVTLAVWPLDMPWHDTATRAVMSNWPPLPQPSGHLCIWKTNTSSDWESTQVSPPCFLRSTCIPILQLSAVGKWRMRTFLNYNDWKMLLSLLNLAVFWFAYIAVS